MTLFLEPLGVAALILLNAFFVAGEYALVTARRTKIQELADQGSRRARAVRQIVADPPRFIAAMQLGVTLTSLGIGALGEQALAHALDPYLATILAVVIRVPDHHLPARRRRGARAKGRGAPLPRADRPRGLGGSARILLFWPTH